MRDLIAAVAGPRSWSDTRESWLARAARKAGISYRQTKSLWYGEIKDPFHRSARLMRDAAELAGRFEKIASCPLAASQVLGCPLLHAVSDTADKLRTVGGTRNDGEGER